MKVFFACRYGLGDILAGYFCPVNYGRPNSRAQLLMRLGNACRAGVCNSAFAVTNLSFWESVDFRVRVRSPDSFASPPPENGWDLDSLEGHQNLLRPPQQLLSFPADPPVRLPLRRPKCDLPSEFILFSDGAGAPDRTLVDRGIVEWLQRTLPVVRVGRSGGRSSLAMGARGSTAAALDLVDCTDLTEVFWLAHHARVIVSPCTYLRTMSALAETPVLELLQTDRVQAATVSRTVKEYCGLEYGMRPGVMNAWTFWNGHASHEAERRLGQFLSRSPARQNV